jgi:hypothetical protein
MVVLAMPLSGLASCCWQLPQAEHCAPHCPTMSAPVSAVTIQQALANGSCCRVSSARPTPASLPEGSSGSGRRAAPTFIASALDIAEVPTKAELADPLARTSCPSSQSVFCIFLI